MIATRIGKVILTRLRDEEKNITGRSIDEEKKISTRRIKVISERRI